DIPPIHFDRSYYLLPEESPAKPYELFWRALVESSKTAITKFFFHDNEYLAAIMPEERLLRLQILHYADEIAVPPAFSSKDQKVAPAELELAIKLIDSLTSSFKPQAFSNETQAKLKKLLNSKSQGRVIHTPVPQKGAAPKVVDLMDRLKKSLREKGAQSRSTTRRSRRRA
ncbi:MAG: hypothetical protein K1X83_15750, partial [Oligoflexia bacterium]|nr:hypothetical protein [Oligoflexia bacterium]